MTVYVAEIYGRGVVAFDAADEVEATARLADQTLLRDLRVCQNEGRSLWDGVSKLVVRKALPQEIDIWRSRETIVALPMVTDDRLWRVFLVPTVDPSDFDDDDDDHDHGD